MHYLAFDFETGGLDTKNHTLLTLYMRILDDKFGFLDELHLKLKPDNGQYNVTDEAMAVTKIDLVEHDKTAITYSQGSKLIKEFLKRNKIKGKRKHFRPLGQNLNFDIECMNNQLISKEDWNNECGVHYNSLDTLQIVTFLKDMEMIPDDLGNLTSLVKYFELSQGEFHNEKDDVLMTIEVYKCFRKMLMSKKGEMSGSSVSSLFSIIEE